MNRESVITVYLEKRQRRSIHDVQMRLRDKHFAEIRPDRKYGNRLAKVAITMRSCFGYGRVQLNLPSPI